MTHVGGSVACPECGNQCTIADHASERTWRHLDTMQFETRLRTRVPRANCKACGAKTIEVVDKARRVQQVEYLLTLLAAQRSRLPWLCTIITFGTLRWLAMSIKSRPTDAHDPTGGRRADLRCELFGGFH